MKKKQYYEEKLIHQLIEIRNNFSRLNSLCRLNQSYNKRQKSQTKFYEGIYRCIGILMNRIIIQKFPKDKVK